MKHLPLCLIAWFVPVLAQTPEQQEAASPVPSTESWLSGSIDLGYRWTSDVAGSFNTYRSIVNLGSGPKLLGTEFTVTDPNRRAFDHVRVRAYNWGDDPYGSLHVDAAKASRYDFSADYRDIAYFNFLPSFADPLLGRGIVLNEQSYDTRRHLGNYSLDLLPGNWVVPYLAFHRDSGSGGGVAVFVSDGNEYPVPNRLRNLTNLYRGGVRFELLRFHATLEQGGTTFKDDQSLFSEERNSGNVFTPVLGRTLALNNLLAAYGIRSNSIYSKGLFTANPTSWLDLYGQFLFSQPATDVDYQQYDTGNFFLRSQALFYTTERYLVTAAAKLPRTSGSFGMEVRPLRRIRIVESWFTDRLHNAGSATQNRGISGIVVNGVANPALSQQISTVLASSLVSNYNQQETNIFFDATSKLTLYGGYRFVWGDASTAVFPAAGLAGADEGRLRRHVGLGGVTFRPGQRISLTAEAEGASSGAAYFRTSLYDYQKVRAQGRYQATDSLSLSADFTLLNNQNPTPGIRYDFLARQQSLSISWSPKGGRTWDLQGSYSRSSLRSNIGYLSPGDLTPQTSFYRENAHTATALLNISLPPVAQLAPRLTAGGSFFRSAGSRPTSNYQPLAKLWLPLGTRTTWFAEWRYYSYGEAFYLYEGFRAHLLTTGLRFTR
jgi:hypothetical protein